MDELFQTQSNPHRKHSRSVRPMIQRAFLVWLLENKSRFKIPLRLSLRTDSCWKFGFTGIAPQVTGYLRRSEIGISVNWQGECWDLLACFEALPVKLDGSYACKLCHDWKGSSLFHSREALWRDHLFEPFLAWVNDELAPAQWLELAGGEGWTAAKLLVERQGASEDRQLIPLRDE